MSLRGDLTRSFKAADGCMQDFPPWEQDAKGALCDPHDDRPPERHEVALALVLHWLRSRKKDIAWCMDMDCRPGPSGHIRKGKGWWMPDPHEACLCQVTISRGGYDREKGKTEWSVNPFAWWHHCKTYEHCLFLVKNKRLLRYRMPHVNLANIASVVENKAIPALANTRDPLAKCFLLDWMDGKVDDDIDTRLGGGSCSI